MLVVVAIDVVVVVEFVVAAEVLGVGMVVVAESPPHEMSAIKTNTEMKVPNAGGRGPRLITGTRVGRLRDSEEGEQWCAPAAR